MLKNKINRKKCKNGEVYKYLYIDKFLYNSLYINIDQSLISLMYFLYFRGNPFNFLERKTNSRFVNFFKPLIRLMRVGQFTYLFYRKKLLYNKTQDSFQTISTPKYGHILIGAAEGEYKVINLMEKSVITVFPEKYSINKIEEKISKLKEAQKCKLSSKILDWNINERYVRERYLNLKTSSFDFNNVQKFYSEVSPILRDIVISDKHQEILLTQYLKDLLKKIKFIIESLIKVSFYLENSVKNIREFISNINEELEKNFSNTVIFLGFSHGDFWEGNILKSKTQTKVIDWNTLEMRNYFFDFYFITFFKVANKQEKDLYNLTKEIDIAFNSFINDCLENTYFNSTFKTNLFTPDIYRYLYYLEYILLELQVNPFKNHFAFLESRINFFRFYESIKNGHPLK